MMGMGGEEDGSEVLDHVMPLNAVALGRRGLG